MNLLRLNPVKCFNLLFSAILILPLSITQTQTDNQQTLSPITAVAPVLDETKRSIVYRTTPEAADGKRESIDPNIFQGYDVRGIALEKGEEKTNLRQEDAFLIAEAIAHEYQKQMPKGKRPRILITGDHRETTQYLIAAAAQGASLQGFEVHFDSGHVPTGAANFYALREGYDAMIQVTGSHNPFHHNGLKIAVKQNSKGFFDPDGKLGALYGNQGKRDFELKSIYDKIIEEKEEIINARNQEGSIEDIHGEELNVEGSYLATVPNRPKFGKIVQAYIDALKEIFPPVKNPRKLVVDPGNGMGAAAILLLEHQGHTIEKGLYVDVKARPVHPADPSKDTAGKAPLEKSGCRACIEEILQTEKELIGILFDGDGDRSGKVDEDGVAIRPPAIATLIYRRFILENKETLEKLEEMGYPITLALDVRSSKVMEDITGVVDLKGKVLKKGPYKGVQGIYIPAGYPSHRDHVAKEIEKLRELKKKIARDKEGEFTDFFSEDNGRLPFLSQIEKLINSFVSAEASGHYFAATDRTHPDTMIDDGIFYAARILQILDTWKDYEEDDQNIRMKKKEIYQLKDIFSQESIPVLPSPDEPRFKGHKDVTDRYEFVRSRQQELLTDFDEQLKEKPLNGTKYSSKRPQIFRGEISFIIGMDQVTDGVRVNFTDGSAFLIRTSNTSAKFTSMIEGPTWDRVVEILEDAIAWLEPIEKRDKQFSIDDLRTSLEEARKKANNVVKKTEKMAPVVVETTSRLPESSI